MIIIQVINRIVNHLSIYYYASNKKNIIIIYSLINQKNLF